MTPEVKWACIRRLEASLANGTGVEYPQAAHDALITMRELHHYKSDSEFLREEKARVWVAVNAPTRPSWWRRVARVIGGGADDRA